MLYHGQFAGQHVTESVFQHQGSAILGRHKQVVIHVHIIAGILLPKLNHLPAPLGVVQRFPALSPHRRLSLAFISTISAIFRACSGCSPNPAISISALHSLAVPYVHHDLTVFVHGRITFELSTLNDLRWHAVYVLRRPWWQRPERAKQ